MTTMEQFFQAHQGSCTCELIAVVTARIRPGQDRSLPHYWLQSFTRCRMGLATIPGPSHVLATRLQLSFFLSFLTHLIVKLKISVQFSLKSSSVVQTAQYVFHTSLSSTYHRDTSVMSCLVDAWTLQWQCRLHKERMPYHFIHFVF